MWAWYNTKHVEGDPCYRIMFCLEHFEWPLGDYDIGVLEHVAIHDTLSEYIVATLRSI